MALLQSNKQLLTLPNKMRLKLTPEENQKKPWLSAPREYTQV